MPEHWISYWDCGHECRGRSEARITKKNVCPKYQGSWHWSCRSLTCNMTHRWGSKTCSHYTKSHKCMCPGWWYWSRTKIIVHACPGKWSLANQSSNTMMVLCISKVIFQYCTQTKRFFLQGTVCLESASLTNINIIILYCVLLSHTEWVFMMHK